MNTACTTCQGLGIADESGQGHYERCADCWGTGQSQWPRPTRLHGVEPRKSVTMVEPIAVRTSWLLQVCAAVLALACVAFVVML